VNFSRLRFFRLLCLLIVCFGFAAYPLPAQTPSGTSVLPTAAAPQWSRLKGDIEMTTAGVTARAKVFVQGPGQVRLEILRDDGAQIAAQTVLSSPDHTLIFDPQTRRVQQQSGSILSLRAWSLPFGGPANFLLGNFADNKKLPPTGKLEVSGFAPTFISDYVQFGGSGDRIFYAPYKRTAWDGAARTLLEWTGAGPVQTRTEFDENGRVLSRASFTYDTKGLPTSAIVTDAENRTLATFKYELQEVTEPFAAEVFALDFPAEKIIEDVPVKAITEYSGADAGSKFNRGVALMRQAEELPAAYAAWEEAAALAPKATAPHFATYETALATRDLNRAQAALTKLIALLGADNYAVAWRTAGVLLARRDWSGAQSALEAATQIEPKNLQAKLSLADVRRSRNDFAGAQTLLLEILQSDAPQSSVQAQATQMLAELASGNTASGDTASGVLPVLGKAIAASSNLKSATANAPTNQDFWLRLTRFIIQLRQGEEFAKIPNEIETENRAALAVLAQELENAGKDALAFAAWQKVASLSPSPTDQNARAHLMSLLARRGDVSSSLAQYRELIAATPSLKLQRVWQEQLLAAWSKAFRLEQLKTALEQRSIGTAATPDDARLWLTYQEIYGTEEGVLRAVQNGLARFTRDAWWRAKHAELLMVQAANTIDSNAMDRLQREALEAAETAVALDKSQPYYAVSRALILTQRATPVTAIIESGRFDAQKKLARQALDELLKTWPDDADVEIAVASQRLALEEDGAHGATIELLQNALRGGAPGAGEDRHFIAFSARQILISALRRDKKWSAIAPQYEILFRTARSGDEQVGVALNYLRLLLKNGESDGITHLLLFMARESWPFEESQQVLAPLLNVVAAKPEILTPVLQSLGQSSDPYARLILAKMMASQLRTARQILEAPEAPDRAERDVIAAEQSLQTALQFLEPLSQSEDKILASRAAATLGEAAVNRSDFADAQKWFERAMELEPRDINLRAAHANTLLAQNKTEAALTARNQMLRALPHTLENLHRIAKISAQIGAPDDKTFVARLAWQAFNRASIAPEVPSGAWQLVAFTAARALFDAGQTEKALAIYNGLSSPQWSGIERAVALIDLEESYKLAGQTQKAQAAATQLEALGLSPQQRNRAEEIWVRLDD
jgi:tetratricopeptide (TPR) repeat protein